MYVRCYFNTPTVESAFTNCLWFLNSTAFLCGFLSFFQHCDSQMLFFQEGLSGTDQMIPPQLCSLCSCNWLKSKPSNHLNTTAQEFLNNYVTNLSFWNLIHFSAIEITNLRDHWLYGQTAQQAFGSPYLCSTWRQDLSEPPNSSLCNLWLLDFSRFSSNKSMLSSGTASWN